MTLCELCVEVFVSKCERTVRACGCVRWYVYRCVVFGCVYLSLCDSLYEYICVEYVYV